MESIHKRGVAEEHPNSHLIQLLAGIIFFVIWILDSFIFTYSTILAIHFPFPIRIIIFLSLLAIGLVLIFLAGHLLFHNKDTTPKLLKTGIFAHSRHPIYLGVFILYIGLIILSMSLISIIGFIIVFILYNRISNYEEKELEKVFKEEYIKYKKEVHRWLSF